jgi:hypothetical protein
MLKLRNLFVCVRGFPNLWRQEGFSVALSLSLLVRIVVCFSHEEAGVLLLPLFKVSMIEVLSISESQKMLAVFLIRALFIFNS